MAIRINNAKDFAGRFYLTVDALNNFIGPLTLNGQKLEFTYTVNGEAAQSRTVDLSGLVIKSAEAQYITVTSNVVDDSALRTFIGTAVAEKIVTTDASGHLAYVNEIGTSVRASGSTSSNVLPNETAIRAAIDEVANQAINITAGDGVTITDVQDSTEKIISTDIKIVKLGEADTGYAATYQLMVKDASGSAADGYVPAGEKIQILKDQFLKGAAFVSAATADDVATAGGANAGFSAGDPVIKFTMELASAGATADADSYLYVPVKELVDVYTPGNGIDITSSNVVSVKLGTSEQVYTSDGAVDVISVDANGLKVSNIQSAIDKAVTAEHVAASAAVDSLNTKINSLATSANAAVSDLNSRIETVASNAQTVAGNLEGEINALDSKVDAAFASADTVIESAVTSAMVNIESAVTAHTANAVQLMLGSATIASGVTGLHSATVESATCIVAVYDGSNQQIYPEIVKSGNGFKLVADFGQAGTSAAETWTYLYTLPLTTYNAAAVTVPDVSYDVTASATHAVGSGTAAGAVTATSDVTKDAPSYK